MAHEHLPFGKLLKPRSWRSSPFLKSQQHLTMLILLKCKLLIFGKQCHVSRIRFRPKGALWGKAWEAVSPPKKKKKITSPQKCVPAPPGPGRTQRKPPRAFPPLLFSSECVQMEPAWRKNKLGFQTHRKQFQACASIFFNFWKNSPYSGLLSVRNLLGLHQFSKYLWPPNIRHARGLP